MVQDFKKLEVYHEAYELALEIYKTLENERNYWLQNQIFKSSTSISANLGEMAAFTHRNQQRQKVLICIGEANETEFWLTFCKDINLISEYKSKKFIDKVIKVRIKLINLLITIDSKIYEERKKFKR